MGLFRWGWIGWFLFDGCFVVWVGVVGLWWVCMVVICCVIVFYVFLLGICWLLYVIVLLGWVWFGCWRLIVYVFMFVGLRFVCFCLLEWFWWVVCDCFFWVLFEFSFVWLGVVGCGLELRCLFLLLWLSGWVLKGLSWWCLRVMSIVWFLCWFYCWL